VSEFKSVIKNKTKLRKREGK